MSMFFEAAKSNRFLPNNAIRTEAPRNQPIIWHRMYSGTNLQGCRPVTANVIVTAGLKCAPDSVAVTQIPSAIVRAQPAAVGQMSANHGAPGAPQSVAETPMPRPRTLSRNEPTTSPRMMDFVVGSGGSTSSSSSLPASALSVVASDIG